ncbi:hypothetical protein F4804DRAFT_80426 [Jackrogersella minutella]|nr:hypothetical protein F4804DRAFT_80426 [Jackrogersella minutella]
MPQPVPRSSSSAAVGQTPILSRRRKIRKGTQSCWECKRRKIRCTFAAPTEATCDGCRSRRTKCISQEFRDEAPSTRNIDRLHRMESLVEKLVEKNSNNASDTLHQCKPNHDDNTEISLSVPTPVHDTYLEAQVTGSHDQLSRALLAAWPNQHDLDLILNVPVGVSVLLHGIVCMPYSRLLSSQFISPRHMLELPPQGSHPVLIARRLLLLGTYIQGIPSSLVEKLIGMTTDYRTIMSHVVTAATRLVTSNDELIDSLEGIECVMIESMYLNNAGNLRRAWLANRRAMVMAQMMGLHIGNSSLNAVLEVDTWDRVDPDYMWFRLVCSDRYLSLMLGLPQGSLDDVFASPKELERCMALERMERIESVAGGLIIQRNSTERTNIAATYKIDKMLQKAATLMPPQWWSMTPDFSSTAGDDPKAFEETIRLMNQFTHYHLLVQLHLPYMMLPSSTNLNYDYSKMTAASASRAILARFVSFRNSSLATAYCRGIDFIAFIASITLCVAHIEVCRQHKTDTSIGLTSFQSLRHQRLSDRGLFEQTLEIMETTAQASHDVVAQKISSILRPLLAIEDKSARGDCYHTTVSSEGDKRGIQQLDDPDEFPNILRIQIPYFGTIMIEHRPTISDNIEPTRTLFEERLQDAYMSQATNTGFTVLRESASSPILEQREKDQGETPSIARQVGYEISTTQPRNTDWQVVPSYFDPPSPHEHPVLANWDENISSADTNNTQEAEPHLLVPGLSTDVSDWALQGVDMALFSNFTAQGSGD